MKTRICPRCNGAGLLAHTTELKRIRRAAGISQGEVARRLNITQGYLSQIENGKAKCPPWIQHLYKDLEVAASLHTGNNGAER